MPERRQHHGREEPGLLNNTDYEMMSQMGNDFLLRWEMQGKHGQVTLHYHQWINAFFDYFKAGQHGRDALMSPKGTGRAGSSAQPGVGPSCSCARLWSWRMPWLCLQLLPTGQGTLLRHFQHQNTGSHSAPMAFKSSSFQEDEARAGQDSQGDSPRSPQHPPACCKHQPRQ